MDQANLGDKKWLKRLVEGDRMQVPRRQGVKRLVERNGDGDVAVMAKEGEAMVRWRWTDTSLEM